MADLKLLVFADFHYKKRMYPASVSHLEEILSRGNSNNVNLCVHVGDFCNDYKNSPEIIKTYLCNKYDLDVFGVYGNHELESAGNSMEIVTPLLSNRSESLLFGTESGKIEDGRIAYSYLDKDCFRLIFLDSNYSLTPDGEYEHNRTASYGKPKENTAPDSLGDIQKKWLRNVLLDAAEKSKKCIVFSHASFSGIWKSSPDADDVRAIFKEINAKHPGTVILAINGHYHSNHIDMVEDVCYFDCHTAINGLWRSEKFYPYAEEKEASPKYTFDFVDYDSDGNPTLSSKMPYSKLSMGAQTLFFESPLSAIVTVGENGSIKIEGSETRFAYGIERPVNESYQPRISNFNKI